MDDTIYCCKIEDVSEFQELLPELLIALDYEYSSWHDKIEKISFHTLYFEEPEQAREAAEQIKLMLPAWKDMGINVSNVETVSIKKEDWAEVWKKYFNILHISERLVIKPSWLEYTQKPGQVIVEIDPGMSFGTGQHATTSFCLKMIDRLADESTVNSFLDAGCGSGILSIAAVKLGYRPISAFDIDPDATRVAKENFEHNKIAPNAIALQTAALDEFEPEQPEYDLVAANILAHILVKNREQIFSLVKPGGYLILAGILNEEFEEVTGQFKALGLSEEYRFSEKEWTSGLFRKQQ